MTPTTWELANHLDGPWAHRIEAATPVLAAKKHCLAVDAATPGLPPIVRTLYVRLPIDAPHMAQVSWGLAPRQVLTIDVHTAYTAHLRNVGGEA